MSSNQPPPPPPPPPSGETPAAEPESKPWWKRWWGITLIVLGVLIIIGLFAGDPEDADDVAAPGETETTEPTPTAEETTESESPDPEPTTEPEPDPTTPEPEPTTEPEIALNEGQQRELFATTFDDIRLDLADALEGTRDVETVDRIEVDDDGNVALAVTSTWASPDNQREGAWATGREMAYLWSDEFWEGAGERDPVWWPSLSMTVSEHSYECSGETMRDLAERRMDRTGWEDAC